MTLTTRLSGMERAGRLLGIAAFAAVSHSASAHQAKIPKHPNIIYIMCDDMGYGDLGCYGQRLIQTPNLDRMAREGMRFTQAYAGSPVSAPSRATVMTGQHSGHTHVRGNREYWSGHAVPNMFGRNSDYSIIGQEPYDTAVSILPELFKQAGYHTGMFGKWAGGYYNLLDPVGGSSASLPNTRGIDVYYGPLCQFQAHTYYPNYLNRYDPSRGDTHVVVDTLKQNIQHAAVASGNADYENREQYSADLIHQYALEWIRRQKKGEPFLGIFTYTLPHAELWQPNDTILQHYDEVFKGQDSPFRGNLHSWYYPNVNRHAQFAAMITRLDAMVGEIFECLRQQGLLENTLVIFTSDNGPHEEGGADPDWFNRDGLLQGKKRSTYEGGIRIPFIACGPGVPAGTVNNHQLAFYDLIPTFLEYAGRRDLVPQRDGISFFPTLTGHDERQARHPHLYWEFHETDMIGVRRDNWKLVVRQGRCFLYDLETDLHEDHNLAPQLPGIVNELKEIVRREHTESPLFKVTLPK